MQLYASLDQIHCKFYNSLFFVWGQAIDPKYVPYCHKRNVICKKSESLF